MSGTVFTIGYTICGSRMARLVELHPHAVIGTFWLPSTVNDYDNLSCKWVDYVLEENQAEALLNNIDALKAEPHLSTHMVILLTGNSSNPGDYTFMAGITRFLESEQLLRELAKHNIPAHTEVSYPRFFREKTAKEKDYKIWDDLTLSDWNEYIRRTLVSKHGQKMLERWWERLNKSAS